MISFFHAIKLGVAAWISYLLGSQIGGSQSPIPHEIGGLWSVISAILVVARHRVESYKLGVRRIVGAFIGCLVGATLIYFLGSPPWLLLIGIFLTAYICFILSLGDYYVPACIATAVVMIIWKIGMDQNPWLYGLSRFLESLIGVVVAFIISHVPPYEKTSS